MLVLSRKSKQEIHIGEDIVVTVLKVKGNTVQLGIQAPREIRVLRGELPKKKAEAIPEPTEPSQPSSLANFTVVFSNSNDDQSAQVNVIPFESPRWPSPPKTTDTGRNESPAKPENNRQNETMQFRGQLPQSLQHNRLKEIVQQLTSKK